MSVGQDNRWQKDAADQNFDYMFKLLIIGNSSVGKTSFLFRYADDSFTSAFVSTVGIDFKVKTVFRQDKRVKLQIWVLASRTNSSRKFVQLGFISDKLFFYVMLCRTRPDRRGTEPSPLPITEGPWDSFWCTTSPMRSLSTASKTGNVWLVLKAFLVRRSTQSFAINWFSSVGALRLRLTRGITRK